MAADEESEKVKVNLALQESAYRHLENMAPHKKAYGDMVSTLIEAEWERRQRGDLHERVSRLEKLTEAMARKLGVVAGSGE